ncbi:hypothetical protein ACM37_04320 [Helicobacter pylori]|nr:hypothetical protein ACM37_04320 [Helicobacter pylori]
MLFLRFLLLRFPLLRFPLLASHFYDSMACFLICPISQLWGVVKSYNKHALKLLNASHPNKSVSLVLK